MKIFFQFSTLKTKFNDFNLLKNSILYFFFLYNYNFSTNKKSSNLQNTQIIYIQYTNSKLLMYLMFELILLIILEILILHQSVRKCNLDQ